MKLVYLAAGIVVLYLAAAPFWDIIVPPAGINEQRIVKEYITESPVTIIEFLDFQCPFCKQAHPIIRELKSRYGDKIRYVPKYFPPQDNELSLKAAMAAICAGEQGLEDTYADALFASVSEKKIIETAENLKMDINQFYECLKYRAESRLESDIQEGIKRGVRGTPTFYVNGVRIEGVPDINAWKNTIEQIISG